MANSTLSRTQVAGNRTTFTFSAWIKRSLLNDYQNILSTGTNTTYRTQLAWHEDDIIQFYNNDNSVNMELKTNRKFRDTNAWYHIVLRFDTTQGTAADRIRLYVNGQQETSFSTATYPAQNNDSTMFNKNGGTVKIGSTAYASSNFFHGYMNNVAFVDGQSLAPTSFGETDSTSGIWKFKSPSGVTYGNNGYHLKMDNSANLGLDSSGETHNFTLSGDGRQAKDTPTNVHATWNSLSYRNNDSQRYVTFSEGNNTAIGNSSTNNGNAYSSLGASSGKFYCEIKATDVRGSGYPNIGFINEAGANRTNGSSGQIGTQGGLAYLPDGRLNDAGNITSSWGASFTDNDVIQLAMDLDNGAFYFGKNGTWQNSGNPASGASKTGAARSFTPDGTFQFFGVAVYESGCEVKANFGNGYFGTTAISSAGSNGNGSLFEYDVPSGYYALNTKNINTYG